MKFAKLTRNNRAIYVNPAHVRAVEETGCIDGERADIYLSDLVTDDGDADCTLLVDESAADAARLIEEASNEQPPHMKAALSMATKAVESLLDTPKVSDYTKGRPLTFVCGCPDDCGKTHVIPAGAIERVEPYPGDLTRSVLIFKNGNTAPVMGTAADIRVELDAANL